MRGLRPAKLSATSAHEIVHPRASFGVWGFRFVGFRRGGGLFFIFWGAGVGFKVYGLVLERLGNSIKAYQTLPRR